jgi:predicted ATPase/DNA-binding CsgD family transcriptional regulator
MEAAAKRRLRVVGEAVPNNLPRYLTSFVGRSTDLTSLKRLLARSRMVSLTGPGGAGKSRLAAELVRACLDRWPEGIWWVELAAVNNPRQVAGAVASALELPGREPAQDVVSAWLAARRALLVLDNCEHLVRACAEFCQAALERCPELTIIATTREALGVPGEAHWHVSSLRMSDAVRLFEARSALVRPGFKVAAPNMEPVKEICEHLDRLPLAIELAAARLGMMTEQEILSQLADRFHLLTGGSRSAPARLQAMSAAIDWSYRLLTEDEALLFRRLSAFRGGFTLESAQAVCANGLTASLLDQIAGLVQKSMVVVEQTEGSESRYRLLETQLAYAEERLQETGELELIRRRHFEYFGDCLSTKTTSHAGPRALIGPRPGFAEAQWIARESANLWAAMHWAQSNAGDLGLGLAADIAGTRIGDLAQVRSLLEELLHRSPASGLARVDALREASAVAYWQGDYEAAIVHAEAGLALARDLGDIEGVARALHATGCAHQARGELATAAEVFDEATSVLKDSSNLRLVNLIRYAIASLAVDRGDCATAREILAECLTGARVEGDVSRTAYLLDCLAWAERGLNEPEAAAASWKEALSIQRGLKNQFGVINCLEGLSCAAEVLGDDRRAVRLAAAATRMAGEMSYRDLPVLLGQLEDSLRRSRARLGARGSEEAWKQGWSMSLDRAADYALGEGEPETGVEAGPLSRREREVVKLVAAGLTNRKIAERLFIAERSAEGHVERIRNKLGVRSRAEVATWAAERGPMTDHLAAEPVPGKKRGTRNGPPSPRR